MNAVISCYLGMLLSVAVTVWAERRTLGRKISLGIQIGVLALTILYYYLMPDYFQQQTVTRWVLYGLGLHWLIAVIGFTGSPRINSFWQYNKNLFLRILTSLLYTMVLYMGLSLALLAIDKLFNADLSYKWYADVWVILIGVFNTWFFLAAFPSEYEDIDEITDYPKGLKVFTQYVLLPILTVYMIILYAYLFKIVFTAHWPSGWVAYLVLGFSVAGILALLLIYPIRNDQRNKWINGYSRFFYFALFPLLLLLGFAIWRRIKEYGITELRYFVILLAIWLLLVATYFLSSRKKNIQLIPLSLCLFAFLSSFGPWSVFSVSRYSQQHRLEQLLVKNGLFKDGKVANARVNVSVKDRKEITATTEYIVSTHGYQPLQPWFHENLDSMMRKDSLMGRYEDRERTEHILKLMHVSYASRYYDDKEEDVQNIRWNLEPGSIALTTEGLPYLIPSVDLTPMGSDSLSVTYQIGKDSVTLSLDSTNEQLRLLPFTGAHATAKDSTISIGLKTLSRYVLVVDQYNNYYDTALSVEKMSMPFHNSRWQGKLVIENMDAIRRNKELHVTRMQGHLLIGPAK
jgi:hypothetical protein